MKRNYDILFNRTECNYLVIDGALHEYIPHPGKTEKLSLNNSPNINIYFEYSLEVEIEGLRMRFHSSKFFENEIYIIPLDNDIKIDEKMKCLFGKTQLILELMVAPNSPIISGYMISTSRINRIIGIKHFRDIATMGQKDEGQFTGEVEEIVLNLDDFDDAIYQRMKQYLYFEIQEHQPSYFETHFIQKELTYPTDEEIEKSRKPGVFYGPWWSTWEENDKCIFEFIAAGQGGALITIEISKNDHEALINGSIDIDELARKYNI